MANHLEPFHVAVCCDIEQYLKNECLMQQSMSTISRILNDIFNNIPINSTLKKVNYYAYGRFPLTRWMVAFNMLRRSSA